LRAERDPDSNLRRALRYRIGDHRVDAGHGEEKGCGGENQEQDQIETAAMELDIAGRRDPGARRDLLRRALRVSAKVMKRRAVRLDLVLCQELLNPIFVYMNVTRLIRQPNLFAPRVEALSSSSDGFGEARFP
jgi:hypothetical protein